MTTSPITPANTEPFKFPSNPDDGCLAHNPVTGAWYKYIEDRNSWVNAGSDADYDDGPINKRVDDLEQWLKNQLETFVTLKVQGTYIFEPYDSEDKFAISDAFKTFEAEHCRPGSRRNPGSPKWSNFENWSECTHIDIHNVPHSGPSAINWNQLYEKGMGWTFYVTPAQQKLPDGSEPPIPLDNYAQLRIQGDAQTERGNPEELLKTRFEVVPVATRGIVEAGKEYLIRFIKTVDEYPAVVVRHCPVDKNNYGEGTLWFNLDDMQLYVLLDNKTNQPNSKQWVTANMPPDINQDQLYNKKIGGQGGTYQAVNWGLEMKDNTQFNTNIHWQLGDHKHSYFSFFPAKRAYEGIPGLFYPVAHVLKPDSGFVVQGDRMLDGPMIYATYKTGSDQKLSIKHLVPPTEEHNAARLADTHSIFKYWGKQKEKGENIPAGHFALYSNTDETKCKDLVLSRIDANGNVVSSPINSNCRNQKRYSSCEYVRIIDPNSNKSYGTDEIGQILLEGYAHTVIINDTDCFQEGTNELTVNGKKGVYGNGGLVYQLDNKSGETWTTYWEGYNAFSKGRYYIIKTPNTK